MDCLREKQMEELIGNLTVGASVKVIRLQMRQEERTLFGMDKFTSPDKAVDMVLPLFHMADREMMVVMSLNTKLEPIAVEVAAVGDLNGCIVTGREIFKHAVLANAASIICFHNHPSGDPVPSGVDSMVTERLRQAGDILGIPLKDHIIVGNGTYYSFSENGKLKG